MDSQMDGWKISPFYRTAALLPPMKTREVEQGKGTADNLMPLGYLFFLSLTMSLLGTVWRTMVV